MQAIEYKTDHKASSTGNAFVEMISVDAINNPGWTCKPINRTEFEETVLLELFADLKVDFSPTVEKNIAAFVERIWRYTQGHWDNTTLFATYLDDALKETTRTYRLITPEVIEEVFRRLLGASYEPGR